MASAEGQDIYLSSLKQFRKRSNIRQVVENFAEEIASHTMSNISNSCLASSVFRVLGVGSGHGKTDLRILNSVATAIESSQKKKPVIHTAIIEPSDMIQEFKSSVTPLPQKLCSLADVSFEWHQKTFQQFIASCPREDYFDMIHFVTSLYYMDAESSLKSSLKLLASGGAMFCLLSSETSFFPKLAKKLKPDCVNLGSAKKIYTQMDVRKIAQRNNWKYEELSRAHYSVDISCCFDESSTEGGLLLDFLTHQENFRVNAESAVYREAMEFLSEECRVDENGAKFIQPEFAAVVIYKQ